MAQALPKPNTNTQICEEIPDSISVASAIADKSAATFNLLGKNNEKHMTTMIDLGNLSGLSQLKLVLNDLDYQNVFLGPHLNSQILKQVVFRWIR